MVKLTARVFGIAIVCFTIGCAEKQASNDTSPPAAPHKAPPPAAEPAMKEPAPPAETEPQAAPAKPAATHEPAAAPEPAKPNVQLANPASVNCVNIGGKLEIQKDPKGEYGVCIFTDGSRCEEWKLYRKQCKPGECREISGQCPAK